MPFLIGLSLLWAFLYWIFGGVIFSIVAILRMGRIHRARFGCLFSLSAVGMGVLAAWSGIRFSRPELIACHPPAALNALPTWQLWLEQFTCGIVGIVGAWVIGFVLLLIVGAVLLQVSKANSKSWIVNKKSQP
mgnify:CR=1 FL=1